MYITTISKISYITNLIIHPRKTTMASSSKNSPINQNKYDFTFVVKQSNLLKQAIDVLSDPEFSPHQYALIQVGTNGCEITVQKVDSDSDNHVFACLRLKATNLENFQCKKPVKKMISLRGLSCALRAAEKLNSESVTIFVVKGSKRLSFQWGSCSSNTFGFGLGHPVSVDLHGGRTAFQNFPNVSYVFEACTSITDLEAMMRNLEWKLFDGAEKSLKKTCEECKVYLLEDPPHSLLLCFNVRQLGDLLFVCDAGSCDVLDHLPCIGRIWSLN